MYRFRRFSHFAGRIARSIAHPSAFLVVLVLVLGWLLSGPMVGFNTLWQTVFNSSTTAVTFLLLFLIQHTQARETAAIQLKLNELIRASEGSHNALLDIEHLTDRDYDLIRENYSLLAQQAREQLKDGNVKWATARVQMESLDSLLDPVDGEEESGGQNAVRTGEATDNGQAENPTNAALDRLALSGANAINVPMVLVSLVSSEFLSFPGQTGLAEPYASRRQAPLSHSFCPQVVATGKSVIVVDARESSSAKNGPMISELGIVAYAGFPLITADNTVVGSFCAIDRQPHVWTEAELNLLQAFAVLAMKEIQQTKGEGRSSSTSNPAIAVQGSSRTSSTVGENGMLRSRGTTILVVDDSATNRKLLAHYLKMDGYKATECSTGEEALTYLRTNSTDLVLLDIMMPGLDGEQVLQTLRADERLRHVPIVMISALDEQESVNRCLHKGAQDYLLKPFTPQTLHACIRKHLESHRPAASRRPAIQPA